jgi:hypothetical protein
MGGQTRPKFADGQIIRMIAEPEAGQRIAHLSRAMSSAPAFSGGKILQLPDNFTVSTKKGSDWLGR